MLTAHGLAPKCSRQRGPGKLPTAHQVPSTCSLPTAKAYKSCGACLLGCLLGGHPRCSAQLLPHCVSAASACAQKTILSLLHQVACGLEYLHGLGIIHGGVTGSARSGLLASIHCRGEHTSSHSATCSQT